VSHYVPGVAARPWRLYYRRYYSEAAIHTSRPTGDADPAHPSALDARHPRSAHLAPTASLPGPWPNICPAAQIADYFRW